MNGERPDLAYLLKDVINITYSNSVMAAEGEAAFESFLSTLNTKFLLVVEGAVSLRDNGMYNVIANYQNRPVTGKEMVQMAAEKAKYIIAVGTCASYGGVSAAAPNVSECVPVDEFLARSDIIKIPGCPGHSDWVAGVIANVILYGMPELDEKNRPVMFYGISIHDRCPRRSYFDKGIFAQNLGEEACLYHVGCKGPRTRTDCPVRQWNNQANWPIGNNASCIGCAHEGFPDDMEPFLSRPKEGTHT